MLVRYRIGAALLVAVGCLFTSLSYADKMSSEAYYVEDLKNSQIIAQKESNNYFPPESTLKNYTAVAALSVLGPSFQYKTRIYFDPKLIRRQSLDGNVTLEFSGDPLFTRKHLGILLNALKTHGVHQINGNIILISDAFDNQPYAEGTAWDHLHVCYAGPVNTLNLDRNCFLFHVFSTPTGHAVDVPSSAQCTNRALGEPCVINQAVTNRDPACSLIFNEKNNQYTLSGCLSTTKKSERMTLSIPNATLYAEFAVKQQLKKLGISLLGKVINGGKKPQGPAIAEQTSLPLSKLIRIMLKMSDNLIANTLIKTVGQYYYHAQGTWARGIAAEKEIISKALNIKKDELFIFDGAGLSYYNAVTPKQEVLLLKYIQKTPALAKVIIPALPVSGMDGTLAGRLPSYAGYIHAKTGSRRDVSALAGYVMMYNKLWAFSAFSVGMPLTRHANARQVDAWVQSLLPTPPQKKKVTKK